VTTQDGGLRPADIETDDTDAVTASEQDVDVEVAYGADVASHSYTGSDDDPAAADDVVTEESATEESATEESVADEPAEPVETDPAEEMRAALRRAPGDWYVVHSYAGYENKVKTNLETRVQTLDVEDFIFQVEVPTEEVTEIKNGQRKQVQRKVLPGYILVRMELNDQSWGAVRNTPGVTGFVGATSKPSALTIDEVVKFLLPRTEAAKPAGSGRSGAATGGRRFG
jgi:transcriptional antiterminator NusG